MSDTEKSEKSEMRDIVNKYKEVMRTKGPKGLQEELTNNLEAWTNTKVNVAVVGNPGTGKSTFINAVLGIDHMDENAAASGIVETTMEIKPYYGKMKSVVFWDLPGVGTPNFPKKNYDDKVKLQTYDYFILIARNRFTENDIWLSKEIKKCNKKFCFVRTHLDEDIENDSKSKPKTHNRQAVIDGIRRDCAENLKDVAPVDIYLIDSFECEKYDFGDLIKTLFQELKGMKAKLLALSLTSATEEIIGEKAKYLIERLVFVYFKIVFKYEKETSDDLAKQTLRYESELYKKVFGIDDETLKMDRNLFKLSQLGTDCKLQELEMIGEKMMESSEQVVDKFHTLFKEDYSFLGIPFNNILFGEIISGILYKMILRYQQFACNIFQNIPIDFAEKCNTD
ncbi:interferon-gamma-inducible GTPase 10-like [Ruditapes philippinarum]|uniref:interferon-gamma-inducible GTPase 10-like n=1 Tax=Ruditapes philippinarum TaxID=129788 RepID=UPI00295AFA9E|nr:interferon-gamma-inducible GTPase 10-like [Ruditapes philippinarum]